MTSPCLPPREEGEPEVRIGHLGSSSSLEVTAQPSDRELLELAAGAIGLPPLKYVGGFVGYWDQTREGKGIGCNVHWNPLTDDGDALRLAVKLNIQIAPDPANSMACAWLAHESDAEPIESTVAVEWWKESKDPYAATRRAIVRAAAAIGRSA